MENKILIGIIGICVVLLVIGIIRHRLELVVNIILRMVMGIVGIYLVNMFLDYQDIGAKVGINEINTFTIGFLGLPGFLLIYGIAFYDTFIKK